MNIEQAGRLLTLAYFLKTEVKPNEFDMETYWSSRRMDVAPDLSEHPCGTSACAFGWCSVVFPSRFKLTTRYGCGFMQSGGLTINFWDAEAMQFFGVDIEEACLLFDSDHVRTPKQEAKVIEQLVFKHGYVYA